MMAGMDRPLSNQPLQDAPLLDARAATRCPMRTHLDIDPPPGTPVEVPLPEATRARMARGTAFEQQVMAELDVLLGPIPSFERDPAGAAEAMTAGAPVLAQVPLRDTPGRRTGRPDLLVATGGTSAVGRPAYVPVDIKAHLVARDHGGGGTFGALRGGPVEGIAAPLDPAALTEQPDRWARRHPRDLMALAHHHRLLEAAGHAVADGAWGGIIGSDRVLAVHDLTAARMASWRNTTGRWSALEKYDRELGFRLDVASVAARRAAGRSDEAPLVVPVRNGDCPTCHHRLWCGPQVEAADDLSLLPGISFDQRHRLHADGITTRADLAAADHDDMPNATLRTAVDHARVVRAGIPAARRRGVADLALPRADVEVDVDMENTPDRRVHLWGARVDGRYVPFADHTAEDFDDTALFARFWAWLMELREVTVATGRTFAAWCWSGPSAEDQYLRLYGPRIGVDVESFIASDEWLDLEAVVGRHLVTGTGTSIKSIAPLAGFVWRDEDPGGDQSMLWWAQAVEGDRSAAERLQDYNADDVAAQAAVRRWLRDTWDALPPVESL